MASFSAYLEVNGQRYPLLTYALGRPASPTQGGQTDCALSAPGADQLFLMQWMFSPTLQEDGKTVDAQGHLEDYQLLQRPYILSNYSGMNDALRRIER